MIFRKEVLIVNSYNCLVIVLERVFFECVSKRLKVLLLGHCWSLVSDFGLNFYIVELFYISHELLCLWETLVCE